MKLTVLGASTVSLAGLVAVGLLSYPVSATAAGVTDEFSKRDDDAAALVLVEEDDDLDDDNDGLAARRDITDTRASGQSRTNDNTGTGWRTGRDKSRARQMKDWTQDGPGTRKRDWSANHTNDRSRHNTRR